MKLKKNGLLLLVLTLALSLFLAACGDGEDVDGTANENGTSNENDSADATEDDNAEEAEGTEENNDGDTDEAAGEPQQGGDLVYGMTAHPTNFNDMYASDTASAYIVDSISASLLRTSPEIEPELFVANDYEVSDDGLTYTFWLHEGVNFHDGEELTADDVKFTYDIFLNEDYTGPRAGSFAHLDEVVVVDDYTVEFHMSEVDASFEYSVFGYNILPEHILGDVPVAELEEHPFNTEETIGAGPFELDEWRDGEYVRVVAFDDYFEDGPYLDSITFKIVTDDSALMAQVEAGDIDYAYIDPPHVAQVEQWDDRYKIESTLGYSYTYLGFNMRHDMFADKETRQAITHALDRETMIEAVAEGYGEVAHAPASPLSWAYTDDITPFDYDPDRARELLAEAGWEEGPDGILERNGEPFSFELKTNQGNPVREQLAVIIQSQLAEVGINAEPNIMEWSAFIDSVQSPNNDYEAIILGWALGSDPDPKAVWHSDEIEAGLNYGAFSREDIDEMIEESQRIVDREERAEILHEIFAEIAEEQPYTFLYYPEFNFAIPTNMHGYTVHPRLHFYRTHEWWLEQE